MALRLALWPVLPETFFLAAAGPVPLEDGLVETCVALMAAHDHTAANRAMMDFFALDLLIDVMLSTCETPLTQQSRANDSG